MRFITYWIIAIMFAGWAAMEKFLAMLKPGSSSTVYWVLIAFSFFFWLCAYGSMIEDKGNTPPADDNPF